MVACTASSEKVPNQSAFFLGRRDLQWSTTNAGTSYTAHKGSHRFTDVKYHPERCDWLLGIQTSAVQCDNGSGTGCYNELYFSKDTGRTWSLLTTYVREFSWGDTSRGDPADRVYVISQESKTGTQELNWSTKFRFAQLDGFKSKETEVIAHGQTFSFFPDYLFVATLTSSGAVELQVQQKQNTQPFRAAVLPTTLEASSFTILDTDMGAVFVHVNHGESSSNHGNIYVSDAVGHRYTLSLSHNSRNRYGACDFERIKGLDGVMLANMVEDPTDNDPRLVSRISLDNGGQWQPLAPPTFDSQGGVIDCTAPACSLHVHGITSAYRSDSWPPFYSNPSAIGLVLATGNVGESLANSESETNTYFSRNAGLTWAEVAKGPHIYEYGDHGALIVIAPLNSPTTQILYTWNQGIDWTAYTFSETPINIDNIITEPAATSQRFVLYGSGVGSESLSGYLVHLNFEGLHERKCQGADAAGSPDSDFELWSPSDGSGTSECLLGRITSYVRRKRDAACYNDVDFERSDVRDNCACTAKDFECDFGYARSEQDPDTCVVANADEILPAPPSPCPSGTKYAVPNGYRPVAGDSCEGGDDRRPKTKKCPSNGSPAVLILFSLLGVSLAAGFIYGYIYNESFRASVKGLGASFSDLLTQRGGRGAYSRVGKMQPDTLMDEEDFALGDSDPEDEPQELPQGTILSAVQQPAKKPANTQLLPMKPSAAGRIQ
eukprot:TRINITY_DN9197_c0_g1_i1.p1 TRINITY_DN9197_c0_g1~~TRINITY_DN9197_c0_g1_i1.p1  ORF type:complete len:806 (-),score=145.71 TRINITY_DN9197_c0_g1_i1:13-2169(-)